MELLKKQGYGSAIDAPITDVIPYDCLFDFLGGSENGAAGRSKESFDRYRFTGGKGRARRYDTAVAPRYDPGLAGTGKYAKIRLCLCRWSGSKADTGNSKRSPGKHGGLDCQLRSHNQLGQIAERAALIDTKVVNALLERREEHLYLTAGEGEWSERNGVGAIGKGYYRGVGHGAQGICVGEAATGDDELGRSTGSNYWGAQAADARNGSCCLAGG